MFDSNQLLPFRTFKTPSKWSDDSCSEQRNELIINTKLDLKVSLPPSPSSFLIGQRGSCPRMDKSRAAADGPESPALWPNVKPGRTLMVGLVSGVRRNRNGLERSIRDRTGPKGPPWWNCRWSGCSSCSSPSHDAAPPSRPVRLNQNRQKNPTLEAENQILLKN